MAWFGLVWYGIVFYFVKFYGTGGFGMICFGMVCFFIFVLHESSIWVESSLDTKYQLPRLFGSG